MRTYVSAGFGEPIGKTWLELARKVASGVRQDIPSGLHAQAVNRLVEEIAKSGMHAIFLIGGWLWGNPDGTYIRMNRAQKPTQAKIAATAGQVLWAAEHYGMGNRVVLEVGPEIDIDPIYKRDLGGLEENCHAVWQAVQTHSRGTPMVAASVSNVRKRDGLRHLGKWLKRAPHRWIAGVHPYRTASRPDSFDGFGSPDQMLKELRVVLAGRKFAITEAGWHDAEQVHRVGPFGLECVPRWLKFRRRTSQFSRSEVATFAQWEIDFWREAGAELFAWYQIRDGHANDPDTETHFGVYHQDRTPKLVAGTLARASLV